MTQVDQGVGALVLGRLVVTGSCMTLDDLCAALAKDVAHPRKQIPKAICRMVTSKYVVRKDRGCYQVTALGKAAEKKGYKCGPQRAHTGTVKPRANTLRQRIWQCLRIEKRINTHDLETVVCNGDESNAQNAVNKYMSLLARAGYVRKLDWRSPGTAPTSPGFAVWLLIRNTGPDAPVAQPAKGGMRDPNTNEFHKFNAEAS